MRRTTQSGIVTFSYLLLVSLLVTFKIVYRQYRRECLKALSKDMYSELDFLDSFAEENPKNYQIWYHRRAIVSMLGDGSRELEFCSKVFETDCKNYHAWAHRYFRIVFCFCCSCSLFALMHLFGRQWAILTFGLWDDELSFIDKLLLSDVRNNSAWNQVA